MPAAKKSVPKKTSGAKSAPKSESNVKLSKKAVVEEKPVVEAKPEPVVEASPVQNEVVEEGPSLHEEMATFMTHFKPLFLHSVLLKPSTDFLRNALAKISKQHKKVLKDAKKKCPTLTVNQVDL